VKRKSGRPQKVGDQLQRELSELIQREVRDPRVGLVTLTGVDMSPDCAHARVRFTCLDPAHAKEAETGLAKASGYLRSALGKRIKLYSTPSLHFVYDASIERADRLSRLIDEANRDPDA